MTEEETLAYDFLQIQPIKLTDEEQANLVDLINEETKIKSYCTFILDKLSGKPLDERKKAWFERLKPDERETLESYALMSKSDLLALKSEVSENQNVNFHKLYASIVLMVYKGLQGKYKNLICSPNKPVLIENTMTEIFKALSAYDRTKGKFTTFITPYILQGGNQTNAELNDTTTRYNYYRKIVWESYYQFAENGQIPTPIKISEHTGIPLQTVITILEKDNLKENSVSIDSLPRVQETFSETHKVDKALVNDSSPEAAFEAKEREEHVHKLLKDSLDTTTKKIVEYKSGIYDSREWTSDEIAAALDIPKAEVESKYNAALRILRKEVENDPLLCNQAVREQRDAYCQVLHFIPTTVSKEDMEDAQFIMDTINLNIQSSIV